MKNLLRSLIACATLPLVAACGHGPVGVALQQKAHLPTAMVAGEERAFGYDLDRYSHQEHPVKGTDGFDWGKDLPPAVDNRQYCSKVADQGKLVHGLWIDERQDGRGLPYYWLRFGREPAEMRPGSDLAARKDNLISVTPLKLDLTDRDAMAELERLIA